MLETWRIGLEEVLEVCGLGSWEVGGWRFEILLGFLVAKWLLGAGSLFVIRVE